MKLARLLVLSIVVSTVAACSSTPPATPVTEVDTGPEDHPADLVAAARHLPRELSLMVVTDDLGDTLENAGRGEIVEHFRKDYEEMVFGMVRTLGYNVLSPEAVADLGVDIHGQAGIGIYHQRNPQPWVVVFFTLSHPERFKNLAYMIANGHVGKKRMGLTVGRDGIMVGRNDVAMLVVGNMGMVITGRRTSAVGRKFLQLEPEESLAHHRPFRVAMRQTRPSAALRGYFNLRGALFAEAKLDPRWAGESGEEAKAEVDRVRARVLAGMRNRAATPERLVAVDKFYEGSRNSVRTTEFHDTIRSLFGKLGGGGFSADLSPRSIDVTAHLDVDADSPFRKLFVAREGAPPLVGGLAEQPALMLGLKLDLPAIVKVARKLGAPIAEANILIGADIESDVLPLLDGEIAVYMAPPKKGVAAIDSPADISGGLLIGVADAKKVDEVFTKFTERGDETAALKADGPRRWKLNKDGWPPLVMKLTDAHLVIATDPDLAERVAKAGKPTGSGRAWQLVTGSGNSVEIYAHIAALLASELTLGSGLFSGSLPPEPKLDRLPWHHPKTQFSDAYRAKIAELHALDAEEEKLERAREHRATQAMIRAAAGLGALGIAIRPTEHGLAAEGSYRTRGRSMAAVVAAMKKGRDARPPHEDDTKLADLEAKRQKLHKELDAIYAQLPKAPPPPKEEPKPAPK